MTATKCWLCGDDLENYSTCIETPIRGRVLCGCCVAWVLLTDRLNRIAEAREAARLELEETERKAEELATGIENGERVVHANTDASCCKHYSASDATFVCTKCKRRVGWCMGRADDQPNVCDDCYVVAP